MACKDQDVLFRPVDPPKDDGHIGGAAAEESHGEGEKVLFKLYNEFERLKGVFLVMAACCLVFKASILHSQTCSC